MKDHTIKFFNKIEAAKSLPTLPHILLKLFEVCNKKPVEIETISQIINKDVSLSARLMSIAHPVCSIPSDRIKSIDQALLFLGPDAIKNIVISSIVQQSFNQTKNSYISSLKILWKHSLMSAVLAKTIAEEISYFNHDEAYLAGLFHDIGKLVLWVNFPEEYTEILQTTRSNPALLLDSERRIGASHDETGAWLINRWAPQSFISDAVLYHHEPKHRILDALPLVKIVYAANILSSGIDKDCNNAFDIAKEVLGLEYSALDTIVSLSDKKVRQSAELLGINIKNLGNFDEPICERDVEKQNELVRTAINISQLQGTLQNLFECHDTDSTLKVVRQGLQILFDLKKVLFFLYDHGKNALQGYIGNREGDNLLIKEIVIPVQGKNCLLTKTLAEKTSLDSFGHIKEINLTIIDSQIIRLSGKEGMLCIPMLSQENCVGVMVIGIDEVQSHILSKDLNFINMFASQVAVAIDTENEKKTKAKLIQSEHLTAPSIVADKVAHEVKNSLSIMKNYLKILGLKLAKNSPAQEEIVIVNEEIDRINLIINGLSNFLEPKVIQKEFVDINTLISDLIKITHEALLVQSNVEAKLSLGTSIPAIMTDKNGLKQVVINLIKNAVEAMPNGGGIEINTKLITRSNGFNKKTDKKKQEFVEIIISDNGSGIPKEKMLNLFEPFVSLKGSGHSGLGLSIVYSIISGLKGTITCESDETTGTTFKILLPFNN
ncbi:MAG: HDOD domain-containing protein [Deltaproteobacteria bacterium]|nr:HDOD domain-containing protein [Deltaproteobacteria bacterium]